MLVSVLLSTCYLAGPLRSIYEANPSLLFVMAMMKLGPVRDAMELAVRTVLSKRSLGPESLYDALVVGIKSLDGVKCPLWYANAGGQSYALGHIVWLKKLGVLGAVRHKTVVATVTLGESSAQLFVHPLTKATLQRLERVLALDRPALACQLRPPGALAGGPDGLE